MGLSSLLSLKPYYVPDAKPLALELAPTPKHVERWLFLKCLAPVLAVSDIGLPARVLEVACGIVFMQSCAFESASWFYRLLGTFGGNSDLKLLNVCARGRTKEEALRR